jgi:2,3-bisphosphoglycerate-dependent phosphoglycerate mutase
VAPPLEDLRWPRSLLVVRHAESAGNVARDHAEAHGLELIDIATRDMDVPLSDLGVRQAEALGRWLRARGDDAPTVALASPYARTVQTAQTALAASGLEAPLILDERLREREFGALDRLTKRGIEVRFPEQAEVRARVGKFYYRPPAGESWCDVALRVRSVIDSISREHAGARLLVVSHEVVIFIFRYVIEHLSETEVLAMSAANELANCSITCFERVTRGDDEVGLELATFNDTAALDADAAPVTREPDVPLGPR